MKQTMSAALANAVKTLRYSASHGSCTETEQMLSTRHQAETPATPRTQEMHKPSVQTSQKSKERDAN